ncbi:hypothetical protein AOE57_00885 [Candidatus Riesia pediculicola]|nr:hypothetical protein AOE57_00885 [Candidatus Riesia pediculicola]
MIKNIHKIMKRILFIAFSLSILTRSVHALEIYDKSGQRIEIFGSIGIQNNRSDFLNEETLNQTNVRITGKKVISHGLTGFGNFELETGMSHSKNSSYSRSNLTTVGLDSEKFGLLEYGKNHTILYDIRKWTQLIQDRIEDKHPHPIQKIKNVHYNLLTYRNFFGTQNRLNFAVQYYGKSLRKLNETVLAVYPGLGFSTDYDLGYGLKMGGSYLDIGQSRLSEQNQMNFQDIKSWNVGLQYKNFKKNFCVSLIYEDTLIDENVHKFQKIEKTQKNNLKNFSLVFETLFEKTKFRPFLGFSNKKQFSGSSLNDLQEDSNKKSIHLGASYRFDKNLIAKLNYQFNVPSFYERNFLGKNSALFGIEYEF